MTSDEKTSYLRIGLGLSGVVVNDFTAEIIWRTVEGLQKKKGKFSVSDQVEIEMLVKGKLEEKKISLEENSKKSESKVLNNKKLKIDIKPNDFRFLNKKGIESTFSCKDTDRGIDMFLMVGNVEAVLTNKQKNRISNFLKMSPVDADGIYREVFEASNNFKSYINSAGRKITFK